MDSETLIMSFDTDYGHRNQNTFHSIYANTTSANHTIIVEFTKPATSKATIQLQSSSQIVKVPVPLSARSVSTTISLTAGASNEVTISSAASIKSIQIASPEGRYYPCTSFTLSGSSKFEQCDAGFCAPVGSKIGYITSADTAHVTIPASVAGASESSTTAKYLEIDYINNDIALATSWEWGSSSRNLTVSLNGGSPVRLEVPLSGRHSELFGPGKGWWDSSTLGILIDGWKNGSNDVVIGNEVGGDVSQTYGADFVGLRLYD
jgi:alpha-galactosidase